MYFKLCGFELEFHRLRYQRVRVPYFNNEYIELERDRLCFLYHMPHIGSGVWERFDGRWIWHGNSWAELQQLKKVRHMSA